MNLSEAMDIPHDRDWEKVWEYKDAFLVHRDTGYPINLSTCTSSAEVLDSIIQFNDKTFATAEGVKALIDAINSILEPQSNLCSSGVDQPMSSENPRRLPS